MVGCATSSLCVVPPVRTNDSLMTRLPLQRCLRSAGLIDFWCSLYLGSVLFCCCCLCSDLLPNAGLHGLNPAFGEYGRISYSRANQRQTCLVGRSPREAAFWNPSGMFWSERHNRLVSCLGLFDHGTVSSTSVIHLLKRTPGVATLTPSLSNCRTLAGSKALREPGNAQR